jgi:hypothetical protein
MRSHVRPAEDLAQHGQHRAAAWSRLPVDCKFHPEGSSLYVLDFGVSRVTRDYMWSFAHTGVLWRVNRTGGAA